jgi:hypothetical protein
MLTFKEAFGRRYDAYTRDQHNATAGMGKHQSAAYRADGGANDEGWDDEPQHKSADHPHAVHINGKKWKTFGSQSHASNVAKKIKGATVHKEEVQIDEAGTSAAIRMQKALEKIKADRERKERLAAPYVPVKSVFKQEKPMKESNEHYEEAEEHLSKANDAEAKGHMKSFHSHMADHHDAMSEWHDSKGRSASADKHADKAEYHHEKSLTIKEAKDAGEYDYEGQMARTQLQTTLRNCEDLIGMIKDDDNMPEWVQSKITLAQDYITTVRDYLQSKEELGEELSDLTRNAKQEKDISTGKKPMPKRKLLGFKQQSC